MSEDQTREDDKARNFFFGDFETRDVMIAGIVVLGVITIGIIILIVACMLTKRETPAKEAQEDEQEKGIDQVSSKLELKSAQCINKSNTSEIVSDQFSNIDVAKSFESQLSLMGPMASHSHIFSQNGGPTNGTSSIMTTLMNGSYTRKPKAEDHELCTSEVTVESDHLPSMRLANQQSITFYKEKKTINRFRDQNHLGHGIVQSPSSAANHNSKGSNIFQISDGSFPEVGNSE